MQGPGDWPTDCNVRLPRSWPSPASSFDLLFLKPCGATVLPDTTRRFTLERSVSAWAVTFWIGPFFEGWALGAVAWGSVAKQHHRPLFTSSQGKRPSEAVMIKKFSRHC